MKNESLSLYISLIGLSLILQSCGGAESPSAPTTKVVSDLEPTLATAGLTPGTAVSLQVTTPGLTERFVRSAQNLGVTEVVNAGSVASLKQDATFDVVAGLADPGCFSLQVRGTPNRYVRHNRFQIRMELNDNSGLFKQDATWCVKPGLSGAGVTLESKNYPGYYLRHQNALLWLASPKGSRPTDGSSNFDQDVTWTVSAPWATSGPIEPPGGCNADPDGAVPDADVEATLTKVGGVASKDSVDAMRAFFSAQNAYFRCDYKGARATLDALWSRFPNRDEAWGYVGDVPDSTVQWNSYYSLKMLDFMVDERLANPDRQPTEHANLSVVAAQCSEGLVPKNYTEYQAKTGTQTRLTPDPRLLADNAASLRQSTALFRAYYSAMTHYEASLDLRVVQIESCTPITDGGVGWDFSALLRKVPQDIQRTTDIWMAVSPIALPKNIPELATKTWLVSYTSWFDNGVTTDRGNGSSPVFVATDGWLLDRKARFDTPAFLRGERQSYLPQWFDHEFFHMVFEAYQKKVDLGVKFDNGGHSWFTRSTWPSDFVGNLEADFYDEALKKRLLPYNTPVKDVLRWTAR